MKRTISAFVASVMAISAVNALLYKTETAAFAANSNIEFEFDEALHEYADSLGNKTDRFLFYNEEYLNKFQSVKFDENDVNYKDYFAQCSNLELADDPLNSFFQCVNSGRCLGMSISQILAHNKVYTPTNIQAGKEKLIDIELNDDVVNTLLNYQTRQLDTDFFLKMYWTFAHYTKEEKVDMLLETAQKATEQGKYFLIILDAKELSHAITGMGIMDGHWEWDGRTFDKCIPTTDTNILTRDENNDFISYGTMEAACVYINSETKEGFIPCQSLRDYGEDLMFVAFSEDDFLNYKGKIAPSFSYETDIPKINCIAVNSNGNYDITVKREDGTSYDGITACDKVFKKDKCDTYFCDGESINVKNTANEQAFEVNIVDINHAIYSDFNGLVTDLFKNDSEFAFNVLEETEYNITLAFEEGSYNFTPHYKYELSGVTDDDMKIIQTDKGIILNGANGIKCSLKTSDVIRNDNGMVISDEDNIQSDNIFANQSVMVAFENNIPKYYIGEQYDEEVQKGDVDCDGIINASDASFVLQAYSALSTGGTTYISEKLADWNNDENVDASDASSILRKYAELSTSKSQQNNS